MFTTFITVALSAAAAVSASVLPRTATQAATYPVPSTYTQLWLEKYDDYHKRYLALDCEAKHNTQFFDDCCHPMLKWEQLATARKPYCIPGAVSSSSAAVVSSTAVATKTATPTSAALIASPTSSVGEECTEDSDDCECVDDDDEGEECEEGEEDCVCEDEEPTSSAALSTPAATHSSTASRSTVLVTSTITASTASSSAAPTSTEAASSSSAPTATSSKASPSSSSKASSSSAKPTSTETPTSTVKPTTATSTKTSSSSAAATSAQVDITKQTTGTLTGGVATFYYQGGVAGACGKVNPDSAMIAAIDGRRYGNLGAISPLCGVQAKVTNEANGKSVFVIISDACPTCISPNSIDLSVGAFTQIATEEQGEVNVTIELMGKN